MDAIFFAGAFCINVWGLLTVAEWPTGAPKWILGGLHGLLLGCSAFGFLVEVHP